MDKYAMEDLFELARDAAVCSGQCQRFYICLTV